MQNIFSYPLLSPQNDKAIYIKNNELFILDGSSKVTTKLSVHFDHVSNIRWSKDGQTIAYLQNKKLQLFCVETGAIIKTFSNEIEAFEWGGEDTLYITRTFERELCVLHIHSEEITSCMKNATISAVLISKNKCIFQSEKHLYLYDLQTKVIEQITSDEGDYRNVAVSFDENYIAFSGGVDGSSSLYVFDTSLHLLQNLTEMVDVYVGDAINRVYSEMYQTKQIQWIETNALYFLVSTMGDVRLYYADLEGSIFPASPEGEHVYDYSVSNNGNWAIITKSNPTIVSQISYVDITMGDDYLIDQQVGLELNNVNRFYEVIQVEFHLYYIWGIFPENSDEIVVFWNNQNEMFGNTYYPKIDERLENNQAVIYMNIPGAAGYDELYRNQNGEIGNKLEPIENAVENFCKKLGVDGIPYKYSDV